MGSCDGCPQRDYRQGLDMARRRWRVRCSSLQLSRLASHLMADFPDLRALPAPQRPPAVSKDDPQAGGDRHPFLCRFRPHAHRALDNGTNRRSRRRQGVWLAGPRHPRSHCRDPAVDDGLHRLAGSAATPAPGELEQLTNCVKPRWRRLTWAAGLRDPIPARARGRGPHTYPACGRQMAPSRHIAPPRILGRKRGIAEIDRPTSIAEGDARDPKATSATQICCDASNCNLRIRYRGWHLEPLCFFWDSAAIGRVRMSMSATPGNAV